MPRMCKVADHSDDHSHGHGVHGNVDPPHSGQLENPARIKIVRKTIARIETLLSEKRINQNSVESE